MNTTKVTLSAGAAVIVAGSLVFAVRMNTPASTQDVQGAIGVASSSNRERNLPAFRRLSPGASVCINPPTNPATVEGQVEDAGQELALQLRAGGFAAGMLGSIPACDAVVFTEITRRGRNAAELDFRVLLSDESVPRLCSSARGKSGDGKPWREAVLRAFDDEAGQILKAQEKGMPIYPDAAATNLPR